MLTKIKTILKRIIPFSALAVCVFYIVQQLLKIEIPIDSGDGLAHYFIANYALENPVLYLDHWGKPFFTLLASPFAVFGIKGVIIFNILLFILTSWVGFLCLRLLNVSVLLHVLVPVTLIYSYDYTSNILSGLTEVLAGFMIVLSAYFLIRKKWVWMAIVMSLLPFCRSEGQLIIVLGIIVLLYNKQYKSLPFLFVGLFVYGVIGIFSFGDFFWYFNQNPYSTKDSIYGSGDWMHFWNLKHQFLGKLGVILTIVGFAALIFVIVKKRIASLRIDFLFFGICTFFCIVLTHAYLWKYGLKGSLGLTRIITIGLPVFVITLCYLIQQLNFQNKIVKGIFIIALPFICYHYQNSLLWVMENNGLDRSVLQSVDFIKNVREKQSKVLYIHPLFAYGMGINPLKENDIFFSGMNRLTKKITDLEYGDFIVRDSHFGPNEMGLPLSTFDSLKEWVLVNELLPSQPGESYHGEKWNVRIYQKIPVEQQQQVIHTSKPLDFTSTKYKLIPELEFVNVLTPYSISEEVSYMEIEYEAENDGGNINLDVNNGARWSSIPIKKGKKSKIKFPINKNEIIKLYFWNPNKEHNVVEIQKITLFSVSFHSVYKL